MENTMSGTPHSTTEKTAPAIQRPVIDSADQHAHGAILATPKPVARVRQRPRPIVQATRHNTLGAVAHPGAAETAIALRTGTEESHAANAPRNKTELVISMLRTENDATISDIMDATSWLTHSVRGFLSGTVRKRLGLILISEVTGDGVRRYKIEVTEAGDAEIGRAMTGAKTEPDPQPAHSERAE
jgi:hypothetical protein